MTEKSFLILHKIIAKTTVHDKRGRSTSSTVGSNTVPAQVSPAPNPEGMLHIWIIIIMNFL